MIAVWLGCKLCWIKTELLFQKWKWICNFIFIYKSILGKLIATVWFRDLVQEEEQLMEEKKKKKDDKKKKEAAQKKVVYDKLC